VSIGDGACGGRTPAELPAPCLGKTLVEVFAGEGVLSGPPLLARHYIRVSEVRRKAREHGHRAGREFLDALDRHVFDLVVKSCAVHNGGKKTLDALVLNYAAGKLKG